MPYWSHLKGWYYGSNCVSSSHTQKNKQTTRYVLKSYPLVLVNVTLLWNKALADVIKLKNGPTRLGWNLIQWLLSLWKGNLNTSETWTQEEPMWRWRQKLIWCSYYCTNQGMAKMATDHQKPEEKYGPSSLSEPPVETNLADILISDVWLPELWENKVCWLSHLVCGTLPQLS